MALLQTQVISSIKFQDQSLNNLSVIAGFIDELNLKIGAAVMVTINIETSDGIINGTLGTLVDVKKNSKKEIHYLVIDL